MTALTYYGSDDVRLDTVPEPVFGGAGCARCNRPYETLGNRSSSLSSVMG